MTINVRQKGQEGEREVAKILNAIVAEVRLNKGYPAYAKEDEIFQRNQNQSAVGGDDLTNPIDLSIEIKRQEALSVGSWWRQCVTSASRKQGLPILAYRQSRKKWNVVMHASLPLQPKNTSSGYASMDNIMVTLSMEDFKSWFRAYYEKQLVRGYQGDGNAN